jgi:hypothetical protein
MPSCCLSHSLDLVRYSVLPTIAAYSVPSGSSSPSSAGLTSQTLWPANKLPTGQPLATCHTCLTKT